MTGLLREQVDFFKNRAHAGFIQRKIHLTFGSFWCKILREISSVKDRIFDRRILMKKRLISLLLITVMLLLCFVGCAEKTGEEIKSQIGEKASADAVTISMYLMSEEPVSERQEALMEEKVNEFTKNYTIRVDLVYCTPDKYYDLLEKNLKKMDDFYSNGAIGKVESDPVYVDENGLPTIYYPPIEEFDVDIFYFSGYDKYVQYKDAGYLNIIDEQEGSSKALLATINKTLKEQFFAVNGGFDAIPTNRQLGEYTFLLLNKDVLDVTNYSKSDITSLVCNGCQDLLQIVSTDEELAGYVPLYSSEGEVNTIGVKYFGADAEGNLTDGFSLLGGTTNSAWVNGTVGAYPEMASVLASKDNGNLTVQEQINILKNYSFNGYYGTKKDADKPFAVGYIKGGLEVVEQYGDEYEIVVAEAPTLDNDDLYESLFAVTRYTNSLSASTEVLKLLNENEDFRNLILYGVEGENYVWVDSDVISNDGTPYQVVSRQMKDPEKIYVMSALKTGNVALAYPEAGQDPTFADKLKEQNDDLVYDYVLGFSFAEGLKTEAIDQDSFDALMNLCKSSDAIYAKIVDAKDQAELDAAWAELAALSESEDYQTVTALGEGSTSPLAYYMSWLTEKGLIAAE